VKKPVKWLGGKPFQGPFWGNKAGYASPLEIEGTPRFPLENLHVNAFPLFWLYTDVLKGSWRRI
jgi:hypothetical protein